MGLHSLLPQTGGSSTWGGITGTLADQTDLNTALGLRALLTANTLTGAQIVSVNGATSTPAVSLTGTIFTGGSATTTKPQMLIEPNGTTSTGWSTNGTLLGLNAPSAFTGNLLDLQLNAGARFKVNSSGALTVASTVSAGSYFFTSDAVYAGGSLGASQFYAASVGVVLGSSTYISFTNGTAIGGTKDIYLRRIAATILGLDDGTNGAALEMREQTAPAAPAANRVRIYSEDNGSGKTRLMAIFPSGAAQQIAIEP